MADNLSLNPTCANNVTDWRGGAWARQTGGSVGDTGRTTHGRVATGTSAYPNIGSAGTITASPATSEGKTYSYVAWVRSSVTRPAVHFLSRYNGSSYDAQVGSAVGVTLTANTWTKVRGTGTVAAGGTYDRIGVHSDLTSATAAGTYDVGAVRIVEGNDPALEFADGDTAGWTWNGTAGNSTSQTTSGSTLSVRSARAASRATAPLLSVPAAVALAVRSARAQTRATSPRLGTPAPAIVLRAPQRKWQFILGPAAGGWKWELTNAKTRRATFRLHDNSQASFSIFGGDPLAGNIAELSTDLHLLRRNKAGVVQQLYRGRIGSVSDELTETGHSVSVPSLDYRAVLARRHLMSGSQVTWTQKDQFEIAFGLITQAQNKTGGDYGIVDGNAPSGMLRDRTYELGDSIGQRLQELSEVENGFDWEIVPDGPSALWFKAWNPERGVNRGVILAYGGLVKSLTRNVDSGDYANAVRVTGQPPEGSSTPPPPHEGVAADITTRPEGRWDKVIGTSIVTTATLAERRTWLLDHHQVIRPAYTVKLKRDAWGGPDHIWLGDPVRLRVNSGRLRVDTILRVHEIDVAIGDAGEEDVTLTLGAPRPDFARRAAANEKRIAELERR